MCANMASIQEPEVQLAQRLASNEKPVRTKAIKKLRKYINVRSHSDTGGFSGDELLKLWKGLFYCLWMQDKPLLQEELSNQISTLIHSFHSIDGQLLYLEGFLQTFKREWTGIDRLRMDKFFQLVRFMFRQTFEMLKRKSWDSSAVATFLELLTTQLLQSGSGAPAGLQFHILDVYMAELAAAGSAELTADQNLIFIEPFCKTAAKTKDRSLFRAICSSVLSTIIDQAPFAIDDLMKEVTAAEASDSDSGQASEEEEEEDEGEQIKEEKSKPAGKKGKWQQINGNKSNEEEGDDEDDDDNDIDDDDGDDDDELLHLEEDSDTEASCDEDVGPVLQFDYAGLANRLFALASRSSTPSPNRQRLYKIVKVLRDLSEGDFPQDEYPEEVSTDEDDEMFGSRKRMKRRGGGAAQEEDEEPPAAKKSKRKKKATLNEQNKDSGKDEEPEPADLTNNENKKKKKKRKKKKKKAGGEENKQEQTEAQSMITETDGGSKTEDLETEAQTQNSLSCVKVTEAAPPEGRSETLLLSEVKKQPTVTVTEETSLPDSEKEEVTSELQPEATEKKKKKKKKGLKVTPQADETVAESAEVVEEAAETAAPPSAKKKKKKGTKAGKNLQEVPDESQVNGVSTDADSPSITCEDSEEKTADEAPTVEAEVEEASRETKTKKKKGKQEEAPPAAEESAATPLKKKRKKNQKESEPEEEEERAAADETPPTTPAKGRKKKKLAAAQAEEEEEEEGDQTQVQVVGKPAKKKKRKIPITFEYEADELEAAASTNGLEGGEAAAKKPKAGGGDESATPLGAKKLKKAKTSSGSASDFITFQSNSTVPTPLFCKTKGTPLAKKKCQTPKSESKKVTFGLKNNKTAEFKKTDRSLLVSPDGSSRVPFDPKQKPKFGVLKSPPTPHPARKTKRKSANNLKSTPKRRPQAADFF